MQEFKNVLILMLDGVADGVGEVIDPETLRFHEDGVAVTVGFPPHGESIGKHLLGVARLHLDGDRLLADLRISESLRLRNFPDLKLAEAIPAIGGYSVNQVPDKGGYTRLKNVVINQLSLSTEKNADMRIGTLGEQGFFPEPGYVEGSSKPDFMVAGPDAAALPDIDVDDKFANAVEAGEVKAPEPKTVLGQLHELRIGEPHDDYVDIKPMFINARDEAFTEGEVCNLSSLDLVRLVKADDTGKKLDTFGHHRFADFRREGSVDSKAIGKDIHEVWASENQDRHGSPWAGDISGTDYVQYAQAYAFLRQVQVEKARRRAQDDRGQQAKQPRSFVSRVFGLFAIIAELGEALTR